MRGVLPRAIEEILNIIKNTSDECTPVEDSYAETYTEDLISINKPPYPHQISLRMSVYMVYADQIYDLQNSAKRVKLDHFVDNQTK